MDFLSSGLFWLFFALVGVFWVIHEFAHGGRDTLSLLINAIDTIAFCIVLILSFIFMWWQGGVAILVSGFIWAIITGFVRGLLIRMSRDENMAYWVGMIFWGLLFVVLWALAVRFLPAGWWVAAINYIGALVTVTAFGWGPWQRLKRTMPSFLAFVLGISICFVIVVLFRFFS